MWRLIAFFGLTACPGPELAPASEATWTVTCYRINDPRHGIPNRPEMTEVLRGDLSVLNLQTAAGFELEGRWEGCRADGFVCRVDIRPKAGEAEL